MAAVGLASRTGNLPAEVTRFVGRTRDISQVRDALGRYRLVTLRGVGGVGKTRLALRVAAGVRRSFDDGVWLVELSALRNTELLARTVATALGVPDEASGDPLDLLADYVADQHLLLLLDTCEHLVDGCALLSEVLLRAAPRLRILATSREPLDVMGEQSLLIAPLEVPSADGPLTDSDAVLLFLDRAEAMVPGFTLNAANEQAVAQICRRLDGIPLALELAAVRLRTMSIDQVVARIDDRFRFLGMARNSGTRHQTLRAAVDWSHELCTPQEQLLWARLSVFPGDFDIEAAERVCAGGLLAGGTLFEVLARLVEKSVVLYEQDGQRYRLLDTLREYGTEQLAIFGEVGELHLRHRDYYLNLTERAAVASLGAGQVSWLLRLQREIHNLRVALDYSYSIPGQETPGLRMTMLLLRHWLMLGQFTEGRRWHARALAFCAESPDAAWAVYGAAVLAVQQGDLDAAEPLLIRAGDLAQKTADRDLMAHVTDARGISLFFTGDLESAGRCHEEALASYAEIGYNEPFALVTPARLASVCLLLGEFDRAIALSEEGLRHSEALGEQWARGTMYWIRGAARWLTGDVAHAIEDALACLRIKETMGDLHTVTMSIDLLSVCLVARGEYVRAAELSGAGDALWKMLRAPVQQGPHYIGIRQANAATCRAELGDERFEVARARGENMSVAEAIALARSEVTAPVRATAATLLTKRELEIAGLVAGGLGNREIAERLVLSKRTVDAHVEHIFAKLGFNSRAQVAVWFSRHEV